MAAVILQKERPQLGVLALLGLRQASLFICNSDEQKELTIHLTHHFVGIWLSRTCLLQLQYLCKQEAWGKRQNVLFIQNNNNKAVETLKPVITVVCVLS